MFRSVGWYLKVTCTLGSDTTNCWTPVASPHVTCVSARKLHKDFSLQPSSSQVGSPVCFDAAVANMAASNENTPDKQLQTALTKEVEVKNKILS